eukprot:7694-Prymnesium_polylepis.3
MATGCQCMVGATATTGLMMASLRSPAHARVAPSPLKPMARAPSRARGKCTRCGGCSTRRSHSRASVCGRPCRAMSRRCGRGSRRRTRIEVVGDTVLRRRPERMAGWLPSRSLPCVCPPSRACVNARGTRSHVCQTTAGSLPYGATPEPDIIIYKD